MKRDRNYDHFSVCKLSGTIISAYYSIQTQLRLNLYVAEARSNIQNGKNCPEIDYFSIVLLYFFFTFKKIQLIGHPTYGTFSLISLAQIGPINWHMTVFEIQL